MIQISHEEAKKIRIRYPKVKIVKTVNKFFVPEYNFIKRFLEESFQNYVVETTVEQKQIEGLYMR